MQAANSRNILASRAAATGSLADTNSANRQQVIDYLNAGNYKGAFTAAAAGGYGANGTNSQEKNALLKQLETGQGLSQLVPGKQWSQADMQQYYSAAMDPTIAHTLVQARDPYNTGQHTTNWGDMNAAKATEDANRNFAQGSYGQAPGSAAPDIGQWASQNNVAGGFDQKWAVPIAAAVAAIAAPYAIPAIAGAVGTGIGATMAAGALYGGAVGAGTSAIGGTDVGKGALTGAIGGGVGAGLSGAAGSLKYGLTDIYGVNPMVAQGLTGAATGAIGGAASSVVHGSSPWNAALAGGLSGAAGSAAGSYGSSLAGGNGIISTLAGDAAGMGAGYLAHKYLTSPSTPSRGPAAPAAPRAPVAPGTPVAPGSPGSPGTQPPSGPPPMFAGPQPAPGNGPANVGSYGGFDTSGLGYAPRTQVQPANVDYNNYGAGPEAQFFKDSAPVANPTSPVATPPAYAGPVSPPGNSYDGGTGGMNASGPGNFPMVTDPGISAGSPVNSGPTPPVSAPVAAPVNAQHNTTWRGYGPHYKF